MTEKFNIVLPVLSLGHSTEKQNKIFLPDFFFRESWKSSLPT